MIKPILISQNTNLDNSNAKITFRGQQFPSGYYEDDVIQDAKRFMHQTGYSWEKTLKEEKLLRLQSRLQEMPILVKILRIIYLGPFALFNGRTLMKEKAETYVRQVARLIPDLLRETART